MSARFVIVVFVHLLISLFFPIGLTYDYVTASCAGRCATHLTVSEGGSELFCDRECSIEQCERGCDIYVGAIDTSCQKVCADSYAQDVRSNTTALTTSGQDGMRNCIQGCMFAMEFYAQDKWDQIMFLNEPELDIDSLGYSSLTLNWYMPNVDFDNYHIQKKIIDVDSGWHSHKQHRFLPDESKIEIWGLRPYVTYKFKVLALLSSLPSLSNSIMESPETSLITTKPHGAPSTAPEILRLTTPSSWAISISWTPPVFPNGKLLSYRIYVTAVGHPVIKPTTIEVPANTTSWILGQLLSSQEYVISLSAWNAEGEGPKSNRSITTPNPGNLSAYETAYLVLGSGNTIVKQNILDVILYGPDNSVIVHKGVNVTVTDLSLHVRRQLIMATDTSGHVTQISMSDKSAKTDHYPSIFEPGAIAVDWLDDRVYVVGRDTHNKYKIYTCPLDEDRCAVVITGLAKPVSDLKVDPINGYLYYVIYGHGHGLYRIDLGDVADNLNSKATFTDAPSKLIIGMNDLRTHVIDYDNVHLYVVNNSARTMLATFLDGTNMRPFHEAHSSAFHEVSSIVFYNETFIWTDRDRLYREEYEPINKKYRHNNLLFFFKPYMGLNVFHPSAQPIPVPSSAPYKLEALFSQKKAVIRWEPPHPLQFQSRGAWNKWTYELRVVKSDNGLDESGDPLVYKISGQNMTLPDLEPDTVYFVKVRARSPTGSGPWSDKFVGRTLKEDGLSVLMGVPGKILEQNFSDDTHRTVVEFFGQAIDIAWHEDLLFWVTQNGTLSTFNRTSHARRNILAATSPYCVAYDWLGHKIYWADNKQQKIRRSDVNGLTSEYIHSSPARDLQVDAVAGRLYWATQNTVETCRMSGEEHQEIFAMSLFNGRHVISLALDFQSNKILWYVKGYNIQSVYISDILTHNAHGPAPNNWRILGDFKSIDRNSGLQYFHQRLFWRTERQSVVVGDMQCNYTSAVSFHNDVTAFGVVHPSLHRYPVGLNKDTVRVIPNPIRSESIQTIGDSSHFNLTWPKSSEVTHGTVFYKVFIEYGADPKPFTTSKHWETITGLSPYTQLVVSIQPYTYWGYADLTTVSVRSPMSKPSEPRSPEVYVIQHKNATASHQSLAADFRWMTPLHTNGIISYHLVTHWMGNGPNALKSEVRIKGTARHFILTPLVKSQTYHFKVKACTEAGCGPESAIKTAVTDALNPVPMLLVASRNAVQLTEMDSRLNSSQLLQEDVKAITFLAKDSPRMFWLDNRNKLYENSGDLFEELVNLEGGGQDLTIDWISRTLYIVESIKNGHGSRIMQYNIDRGGYTEFITRQAKVGSVVADPYNSAILWSEQSLTGIGQIMSADSITGAVDIVIGGEDSRSRRSSVTGGCTCLRSMDVAPVIAMDYKKGDGATEIVFADKNTDTVYSSDINGCQCTKLFSQTSSGAAYGLPPDLLAVDHKRVSWYNKAQGKLYSAIKSTGEGLLTKNIPEVQDILAYGSHLQPLPDSQCLDPGAYNSTVQTLLVNSTSIHLRLSAPTRPHDCDGISAPKDKFTVYYRKVEVSKAGAVMGDCRANPSICQTEETYTTLVQLNHLEPHTEYLVQVAVSNYYTEYLSEAMSSPLQYKTKFGVPSQVRNFKVNALSPNRVYANWIPPLKFNGPPENVTYIVEFSTLTGEGLVQRQIEPYLDDYYNNGFVDVVLDQLLPDHTYKIHVKSCTAGGTLCSTSETKTARTFPTPGDLKFINSTAHSITFKWLPPPEGNCSFYTVHCAEVTEDAELNMGPCGDLYNLPCSDQGRTAPYITNVIEVLEPHKRYAFALNIAYNGRPFDLAHFDWPPRDNQQKYTFQTSIYFPQQPFPPSVSKLKNGAYEVQWEEPEDNGGPITAYMLEYRDLEKGVWSMAYNGSLERWLVDGSHLKGGHAYVFRVAAVNSKGMGPFSENSTVFMASFAPKEGSMNDQMIIGIVVAIILILIIVLVVIICVTKKRMEKTKIQQFIIRGPDTELATLRELPHTAFQTSNTLYAISIKCTDEEIAKLPHFSREQIILTMFLGSGAFGEVFEGLAKNILTDSSGETKCAVKTLRKSASAHEKEEFLKEALLMKNFQHEHILSLLGVCLDNDPQFIIMELMEGGDLLSFLRSCRATSTTPAKLLLPDLVKICVHVARGCRYLEDMHFVHRDLAARNCLVSSKSSSEMIVKIGDFGLARDIYKNDYYRKEGEGLLPVRWMSPESLVDGFFTTQSDIWAFGVLMWEVITLGQQPYPARTNIEVLHFVRDQGKLERPEKCADEMYSLMRKCWSFNADDRPGFAYLLEELENFQEKCRHMTPEQIAQLSPSVQDGGGSVRLTQAAKTKRLNDLLGSPEKQVIDLTKIGRKRTHSLDSENKADSFPAAQEYDHQGYLKPKGAKGGGRYLELLNYAPELRDIKDPYGNPLAARNGSAFTPVHVTRKGYHPRLSADEDSEEASCLRGNAEGYGYDPNLGGAAYCGNSDDDSYSFNSRGTSNSGPYRLVSVEETPLYSQVCDARRLPSNDSFHSDSMFYPTQVMLGPSETSMKLLPNQRKNSDQDPYYSTAQYRWRSPSSSSKQEHPYSSVECNNNNNNNYSGSACIAAGAGSYSGCDNNGSRRSSTRSGKYSNYAKPGLAYQQGSGEGLNQDYGLQVRDLNCSPKRRVNRENWANNLDEVFLDDTVSSACSSSQYGGEVVQYQGQGQQNGRSRGQVYPENSHALVGYEGGQVSLV